MSDTHGAGHNSGVSVELLKSYVERIERVEGEQVALADDKKEIYSQLKSDGFDPKITRRVIALRKMDPAKRAEQESLLGMYLDAVGT